MRHNQARWCGMIQYSALVYSVFFNNKCNTFFGLNLTLVYSFPMCMAWRFHFPIRNYDFKCYVTQVGWGINFSGKKHYEGVHKVQCY